MQAEDILHFWFDELSPAQHFAQEDAIDAMIRVRFGATWQAAQRCELWGWRATPQGRLAEIVVLDQFSRNIHRGTPLAFAQDAQALVLAQELVAGGHDAALPPAQRAFAYLPYMHSESAAIHAQAMVLFDQPGLENNLRFEVLHRDIIARFGRYPHRNATLGRVSTPGELAFLAQPGSSF
ncbi:MAG: DUF924 domain-containing protein [Gammaproteobacteria bacterium]|jgi:uncharacterized protein (DUF924 family)|uniref:DUF924 family protein n=1 Tax=Acidovorax sp. JG5 TaxID=2822718 RepID=UPI001B32C6EE|nr:DUF924 family protein [Acidovorax sp. JG5]MBP3982013.1 DUF924 domain-containing protein [Acidovorax sp. JG5]MBU4424389.1 DUF924 domain-containing protein [Gammaproteobacteria bacterium]